MTTASTYQREARKARIFNIAVLGLALLGLSTIMCSSGCHRLPEPSVVTDVLSTPTVEVSLHGSEAAAVKRAFAARGGVVDLAAVTIGNVIIYLEPGPPEPWLRRHEYCHVLQGRADPAFLIRYAVEAQLVGYAKNKFEEACRAVEDDAAAPTADVESVRSDGGVDVGGDELGVAEQRDAVAAEALPAQ